MNSILNTIKQNSKLVIVLLLLGAIIGFFVGRSSSVGNKDRLDMQQISESEVKQAPEIWTCSMHPQVRQEEPGQCPICGMDLIPLETEPGADHEIDPNEVQLSESAMKLAEVQTMKVRKDYSNKELYLLGRIKPDERNIAELTARFGGRIEQLFVNFTGQHVQKGAKLATVYSPELVTAQKELLEAIPYKETNPAFYRAARNKLKLWDLTEEQISGIEEQGEPRNFFDVLSPITGTVTMRHVAMGDYIEEGTALFQVINLDKVWAMFEAYESDLPWLQQGDPVEFTVQSLPGKSFKGKVAYIDPFLNPETRTANVRVEVDNSNRQLKPEMFVNGIVKSDISGNQKDLLIPRTSVLWTGKRSVVYVKVPGRGRASFLYREITLGPQAGDFYVVKDGLSEGEEIAVNGVFKIDAAAQLAGKTSMMNPEGGAISTGHQHGNGTMNMDENTRDEHAAHSSAEMVKDDPVVHPANVGHTMFKVSGNCGMCKARIEKTALALDGVNAAEWDQETKMLHLSFNSDKVKIRDVHKAIAQAGHDTELETAPQEIYDELPGCCKYTRE